MKCEINVEDEKLAQCYNVLITHDSLSAEVGIDKGIKQGEGLYTVWS